MQRAKAHADARGTKQRSAIRPTRRQALTEDLQLFRANGCAVKVEYCSDTTHRLSLSSPAISRESPTRNLSEVLAHVLMVADDLTDDFHPRVRLEWLFANTDLHVGRKPVLAQEACRYRRLLQAQRLFRWPNRRGTLRFAQRRSIAGLQPAPFIRHRPLPNEFVPCVKSAAPANHSLESEVNKCGRMGAA